MHAKKMQFKTENKQFLTKIPKCCQFFAETTNFRQKTPNACQINCKSSPKTNNSWRKYSIHAEIFLIVAKNLPMYCRKTHNFWQKISNYWQKPKKCQKLTSCLQKGIKVLQKKIPNIAKNTQFLANKTFPARKTQLMPTTPLQEYRIKKFLQEYSIKVNAKK